jgi:uronate dehydrogenase
MMQRILLTGAAGGIGTRLRKMLPAHYPALRLSDLNAPAELSASEEFVAADLADLGQCERICEGIDGIVHLGGQSLEAPWETILNANIVGTYNLFEAAKRKGVKRVVFASTNHVIGFYPRSRRIGTEELLLPDSRYGVSKAFGESVGALYAMKFGLHVLSLRIGNVADAPSNLRLMSIWLSPDDLLQLIRIGLEHPDLRYEVFYGVSGNDRGWWDNAAAFRYGYRPKGNSETMREAALAGERNVEKDPVGDYVQGGRFASQEFDGDFEALKNLG